MDSQQTYEWAVRYPETVKRAAPIGGTAMNPVISRVLVDALTDAVRSDPNWDDGYCTDPSAVLPIRQFEAWIDCMTVRLTSALIDGTCSDQDGRRPPCAPIRRSSGV